MLLLSIDTSGRSGSIALAQGKDDGSCEVIEVVALTGGTFSAQLVPQIADLLANQRFTRFDIDAFSVASGPGSFTGLRIGLAAIKAFAEILQRPIATVSVLEAVAIGAKMQGRVLAVLDAGRGELYRGEYEVTGDSVRCVAETLLKREEVFADLRELQRHEPETPNPASLRSTVAASDKAIAEAFQSAGLRVVLVDPIDAGAIARLGFRKIRAGQTVSPEQLEANYIRRTDAEILAKVSS